VKLQIPDFSKARILVVGDLMLDRYWQGATSRISPEAPVPIVHIKDTEARPGGAGNVALNISELGATVLVDGLVGDDEGGELLSSQLTDRGVTCLFKGQQDISTIIKLRVLSLHQQLIRLDFEENIHTTNNTDIISRFKKHISDSDVVVLSDYGKGTLSDIQNFINIARDQIKPVLVDPKGSDFDKYQGATLLTPNYAEFTNIVGQCTTSDELISKGTALCKRLDIAALLVTQGEQGMTLIQKEANAIHLPTKARDVYDVTGAGDTVISTLAAGLAAKLSLSQATGLANIAASITVGKLGAASVSVEELREAIKATEIANLNVTSGVVSEAVLLDAVKHARALGEKVIMTNGCFDLLHAGHVSYLDKAKQLGDRLIIAVNDDASVKKLKGNSRPINPLDSRMKVLAALRSADWVVPFSENTPERLICAVKPDVLVKGGDYRPEEIAGNNCVSDNGGEVRVLDLEAGISTSNIIKSIQK